MKVFFLYLLFCDFRLRVYFSLKRQFITRQNSDSFYSDFVDCTGYFIFYVDKFIKIAQFWDSWLTVYLDNLYSRVAWLFFVFSVVSCRLSYS
jgi:hypothetical protein